MRGDEAMNLPHNDLIGDLRSALLERGAALPQRRRDAKRMFFTPVEDFFVGRHAGVKLRARIARTSLDPIWRLMMRERACAEAALAAASLDDAIYHGGDLKGLRTALFTAAEAGIARLIAHTREDAAYRRTVVAQLGGEDAFADLQELSILLPGVSFLDALQKLVPSADGSLSEQQIMDVRGIFLSAYKESKHLGGYVLLALKGRLEQPWRTLKVYYHLARSADEALLAAKETVDWLPESLFEDLETMARTLEAAALEALDPHSVKIRIEYFADYADGLISQAMKTGDNVSTNRVEACRDVAGDALERYIEQALVALRAGLPLRQAGGSSRLAAQRPDYSKALPPALIDMSVAAAELIAAAPSMAERLTRDGEFAAASFDDARDQARAYGKDLVAEIRAAEGDTRAAARRALDTALKIAEPLLSRDQIDVLRDRAAAAALAI